MIARASRWVLVVATAWGLRRGIAPIDMARALGRALPHRDSAWRKALLDDATDRNQARYNAANGGHYGY